MDSRITTLLKQVQSAQRNLKKAICRVQQKCTHEQIAECEYYSNGYSSLCPERICLNCGMTEEGWGCGYLILTGNLTGNNFNIGKISRDELYRLRQGLRIQHNHKGPLLRNEINVYTLINDMLDDIKNEKR